MRLAASLLVLLAVLFGATTRAEAADAPAARTVLLYTIGPGDAFYSRYGHSLVCVREAGAAEESGRCFDYGIADRDDFFHIGWTSVRGSAAFVPIAVEERVVLASFGGEGRAIERQVLPLAAAEADALITRMEREVRERTAYAYHPYFANCTTALRDRIDGVTAGRLRPGRATPASARFREIMEEGVSGRLGELLLMALFLGAPNDHVPNGWEIMYVPSALRDGVLDRFGAAVESVAERQAVILPTSRSVGKVALFVLSLLLFATVRGAARFARLRSALFAVGFVLGTLGAAVGMVAALVVWPELSRNWALAVLLPTDLALPYLSPPWLVRYARIRIAMVGLLGLLELVSVITQPILPLVALVAMPMWAIVTVLRDELVTSPRASLRAPPIAQ